MSLLISSIWNRKVTKQAASLSLWLTLHCPLSQKGCHLEADKADDLLWEIADYLQPPPSQAATRRWVTQKQAHNQEVHLCRAGLMDIHTDISSIQGDLHSSDRLIMAVAKDFEAGED